jgi:hypothetical protein
MRIEAGAWEYGEVVAVIWGILLDVGCSTFGEEIG